MKTWKTLKTVTVGMLVVFGTVFVMGNTAPTCVPLEPEMEVVCLSAEECAALTPDVDCIGEWACENGDCVFHCDEDPEPPVSECDYDGDCAPNQHCEIVDCWAPPCDEDGPCALCCMPIGECIDDEPGECFEDSDCPDGFYCDPLVWFAEEVPGDPDGEEPYYAPVGMGQCLPLPQPGCLEDADCGPGFVCELIDECIPLPCEDEEGVPLPCDWNYEFDGEVDCAPYGVCVPEIEPGCFIDEDCPEGFVCEYLDGPYPSYPCECDPDDDYCLMMDCMPLGVCVEAPEPEFTCNPTGCSGQICAPFGIDTTCEWLPHYACFKNANCGHFGPNGGCAWEHTPELSACLAANL